MRAFVRRRDGPRGIPVARHVARLERLARTEVTMLYLLAIVFPPLAVLLTGRPFQALLNLGLTVLFWVPGVVHALFVVNDHKANQRQERLIEEMRRSRTL
jgi:uncharacterized membrane protein YqaE (UPF0057 family)